VQDVKTLEDTILTEIKRHPEKCMSFDEIVEKLWNPEPIPNIVYALNNLVKRGFLRQFRDIHYGTIQNHYRLVE